jgi:F-type H+-transporting ATPase subunit gamma
VLGEITDAGQAAVSAESGDATATVGADEAHHPLLVCRPEKRVMLVVLTSDRGLCGSFNTSINKLAEKEWHRREAEGQEVKMLVIGRKGRDYFTRRGAPMEYLGGVWDDLGWDSARKLGRHILQHFLGEKDSVDAIYFVYNEFKSAITQQVTVERLLPVPPPEADAEPTDDGMRTEFLFEPDEAGLLRQLVPMYVQVSILRALYESMASELGARMTAMDSATNNASEMIAKLTLQYNRARQAAITTELMEIISGAEALKG